MWVTEDGVAHTIALPDPADVLTPQALASFSRLVAGADQDELELWIDDRLIDLHETGFEPDPEGVFVERVPEAGLLDGDLSSREGVLEALSGIDPRWQVDLLFALQDIRDSLGSTA